MPYVLAGTAAAIAVALAAWAYDPAPPNPAGGTATRSSPMATPDAWTHWRPHLESRLVAEISVPSPYRREPVTSEAALAQD